MGDKEVNQLTNQPQTLLWESTFSFYCDISIDDYLDDLYTWTDEHGVSENNIQGVDRGDKIDLIIHGNNTITGWLISRLEIENDKLKISGSVGIDPRIIFLVAPRIVPVFCFSLVIVPQSLLFSLFVGSFGILFVFIVMFGIKRMKKQLLNIIKNSQQFD